MKPHDEWLFKAEQDLKSAEYLLTSPVKLYDVAIYHAQQCAEKSIKAWLAKNEKANEKTHNLVFLCQIAMEIDSEFSTLLDQAVLLNPYATLYRYPEGELLPSETELCIAIEAAREVFTFIQKKFKDSNSR